MPPLRPRVVAARPPPRQLRTAGHRLGSIVAWPVALLAVALVIGALPLPLATTFAAISNGLCWTAFEIDMIQKSVIRDYRLSRAPVAALCGAGLALCGAILQALLRNPIAEHDVLGIAASVASTGAVA
jgi:iron complex transport system permease protein